MGASSSSSSASSQALHEQESLAASTASLPFLRSAFSSSSSSPLDLPNLLSPNPNPNLLPHLGPSIASLLFPSPSPSWIEFLTGYNSCCARMAASSSVNLLFKVYNEACARAGRPCKLDVDSDPDKVGGEFKASDLLSLFTMCWGMERSWRVGGRESGFEVPDLTHLVTAALGLSGEEEDERVWEGDVAGIERSVSAQKVLMWVIGSVPGLANCLPRYVQEKIKAFAAAVDSTGVSKKSLSCVVIAL